MNRRSIRCSVLLGAYGAAMVFAGCSGKLPQDMCNWIADPNNCLARFATDIGLQCGNTFQEGSDPTKTTTGYFAVRNMLDICIRNAGGQVIFDPPLKVTDFPLTSVSVKMLDIKGQPCGKVSASGPHAFSVQIEPAKTNNPADPVSGGTFSIAPSDETSVSTFDVTCPGGAETHHFNDLVLEKCVIKGNDGSAISAQPFEPTAILESSPGTPETDNAPGVIGYVRLRVQYPPTDIHVKGAAPTVVEYFNCAIPAPPPPCQDGVKNGDETAIDCGGSCAIKKGIKCPDGQACVVSGDCQSGVCTLVAGISQCAKAM